MLFFWPGGQMSENIPTEITDEITKIKITETVTIRYSVNHASNRDLSK